MNRRKEPPRRVDQPEPGYFRTRQVRKGPFVAARICYDAPLWSAEIDGKPCGLPATDPAKADGVFAIWTFGERITPVEYEKLLNTHRPVAADAPVNVNAIPPVF